MRVSPWIATLYGLGVVLMLARLSLGVRAANRLGRRGTILRDGPFVEFVRTMAAKWSLRAVPLLVRVDEIVIPKVVGLVWPRILLPASALSGLSASQLEMILIHELAHLRRHDMWVNLVQRLAESVLFFNPAAWYLSRRISMLRECCCDELTCRTLSSEGDQSKMDYARALLRVVELARFSTNPAAAAGSGEHDDLVALAADGHTASQLRARIASLFGEPVRDPLRLSIGGILMVAALAMILLLSPALWRIAAKSADGASEAVQVRAQPGLPPAKAVAAPIDLSRHVVMIEAESRPQGISKTFPAIVMASNGDRSVLLSGSWGAELFPLNKPGIPIGVLHLRDSGDPVSVVAYDVRRGIGLYSVSRPLDPVPQECFTEQLALGDTLTELQAKQSDSKGPFDPQTPVRVVAVNETYRDNSNFTRPTVDVEHAVRLDGGAKCGSALMKGGKIAAIFLNNGSTPGTEKLFGYALPTKYALKAFAELSASSDTSPKPGEIAEQVFIIARHVMLHGDQVITWDGIRDLLEKMVRQGPVRPSFQFTNGANGQSNEIQQRAFQLDRKLGFKGMTVGFLSPRAGSRYDAVRSQADLNPVPPDARQGSVRQSDGLPDDRARIMGSPVSGAQVVLLPNYAVEGDGGFTIYLKGGRLRAPYEEIATQTDAAGLFTVYESGRFQLVVLHKAGFAVVNSEQIRYQPIILHPWVHIAGTIDRRDNPKQGINVTATAKSPDGWPPIHLLDFDVPVAENGSFEDLYTPPGDVSVQRHVPGENGMSYLLAAQLIKDAKPGSLHRVTIGQLTADDYKRLNFVRNPHK
jgi:hypothetical protein